MTCKETSSGYFVLGALRGCIMVSKSKCRVQCMDWNNLMQQYGLGAHCLGRNGRGGHSLMSMGQECALVVKTTNSIRGYMNQDCSQHVERNDYFSLFLEYFGHLNTSKILLLWSGQRPPGWVRGLETIPGKGRPSGMLNGCTSCLRHSILDTAALCQTWWRWSSTSF